MIDTNACLNLPGDVRRAFAALEEESAFDRARIALKLRALGRALHDMDPARFEQLDAVANLLERGTFTPPGCSW